MNSKKIVFSMNRCSPNGNCLYNAVSILLKGNESLATSLRLLTSVELFENSEYYAKHPRMEEVLSSNAEQFLNQNNAFSALLSDESSKCFKGDRVECINKEAALNLRDSNWSSMVCMMALSSVIKRHIISIYPKCSETKIRALLDCTIRPRVEVNVIDPIRILWSRAGGLDARPNSRFAPNHFVPVIRYNEDLQGVLEKDATLQQLNKNNDVRFVDARRKRDLKQTKLCFSSQKRPFDQQDGNIAQVQIDQTEMVDTSGASSLVDSSFNLEEDSQEIPLKYQKKGEANITDSIEICKYDIGFYYEKSNSLSDSEKLELLERTWRPEANFSFPTTEQSGKKRKFNIIWLSKHPWLAYSKLLDGAFCKLCVLFGRPGSDKSSDRLVKLFNSPYNYWTGASHKLKMHEEKSRLHHDALLSCALFKEMMQNRALRIDQCMSSIIKQRVQSNRKKLLPIIETVVFCGRQNIPLRGHRDDARNMYDGNPGNFQGLLDFRVQAGDEILKEHFTNSPRNATYRSKTIQNELISCCGEIVRKKIVGDVRKANFFSILADGSTDCSNKEQMAFIVRFVDEKSEIREDFLGFFPCKEGVRGAQIATLLKDKAAELGLEMENCRGQGYDGAGNMAGKYIGAATLISKEYPAALYVHCAAHRLNLCVADACKVQTIKNMMSVVRKASYFFDGSPKRQQILEKYIKECCPQSSHRTLVDVCRTRWVERIDGISRFEEMLPAVIKTWEEMKSNENDIYNADTSSDAESLYAYCKKFSVVFALVVTRECFYRIRGATLMLQSRSHMDIMKGYSVVENVQMTLEDVRRNVEEYHHLWFTRANELCTTIGGQFDVIRLCGSQTLRNNHPVQSKEDYYRVSVTIPFLDHLISQIKLRFSTNHLVHAKGFALVPAILKEQSDDAKRWSANVKSFLDNCKSDLPHPLGIDAELDLWRMHWSREDVIELPGKIYQTLKVTDKMIFPNIYTALKILATLPITTCEAERSISVIRRLKTYMRSTMSQTRLNGLALLNIHRDIEVDPNEVLDTFASKHERRLRMSNILDTDG